MTESHDAIDRVQHIIDAADPAIRAAETVDRLTTPAFHLGDRMAKALEVAEVTRSEMAEYMDVSTETLRRWTTMTSPVRKSTLRLWAMRTGVDLEWLETGQAPTLEESRPAADELPRLDSNQQPSGYTLSLVRGGARGRILCTPRPRPAPVEDLAQVVDLDARRAS